MNEPTEFDRQAAEKSVQKYLAKVERQELKAYKPVGEYVISFEMMLQQIRLFIKKCAEVNGIKNQKLIDILLHDSMAKNLLDYFKAYVYELYGDQMKEPTIEKYMKALFKGIEEAYQKRNDIVHSSFKYDVINFKHLIVAEKHKVHKDGLKNIYEESPIDYKELSTFSIYLRSLGSNIEGITLNVGSKNKLTFPYDEYFDDYFEFPKKEKVVSVPKKKSAKAKKK